MNQPLLMIPGPIEVSPAVRSAYEIAPPSHVSRACIDAFGRSLERMRYVWKSEPDAQPFIVAGSGTLAMEMAVVNLVQAGDHVVVVNSGYFSDRVGIMLERRGATVTHVRAARPGAVPGIPMVGEVLRQHRPVVMFATHVDTSTGARVDAHALADLARDLGILSVFDGVCATGGEDFDMGTCGADVYLTASQKAIGLPPGLALLVASQRAMTRRNELTQLPPLGLDFHAWLPIMQAYEDRRPSYFATPATNLIMALDTSLGELLSHGIDATIERHKKVAAAMRRAWETLGLELLSDPSHTANTLSAIRYPTGLDVSLVAEILAHDVVVAGGLHPDVKEQYFRVGHMGYCTTQPEMLEMTVVAVGKALNAKGFPCDVEDAQNVIRTML